MNVFQGSLQLLGSDPFSLCLTAYEAPYTPTFLLFPVFQVLLVLLKSLFDVLSLSLEV